MPDGYLLCFDFGLRYIGCALGQTITSTARPLKTIGAKAGKPEWPILDELFKTWQPVYTLVGLPLNMDDSESDMSIAARRFARQLERRYTVHVEMVDERLSSKEADWRAADDRHAVSAQVIAETWLNQRR
ncbi:MAG: Holliday junction resolvase RuvX [Proteobacteria bacterium]|nr:Holliday junction resolvase RuvX [Pseudomonadota bacterium]